MNGPTARPREARQIPQAGQVDELTIDTLFERRNGLECFVEQTASSATILFPSSSVRGPLAIAPALEYIRDHERFRAADLPGLRDDASRLVLSRRLVREGLLRVVTDSAEPDGMLPPPITSQGEAVGRSKGTLIIVGSGIKSLGHMTIEAQGWIRTADVVLHCLSDPVTEIWIKQNSRSSIDLRALYSEHCQRTDVYSAMVEHLLRPVREGKTVCAVFYGHPGVFVTPTHRAIAAARAEGYSARMLPGVSASDCLYADVGFDPAIAGSQFYDATDLLLHHRVLHPDNSVIIWQVGTVGNSTSRNDSSKLPILIEYLEQFYDPETAVVHYQGSVFPVCTSLVERLPLRELGKGARVTSMSTLYIPPQRHPERDREMARRLGLVVEEAQDGGESAAAGPPRYRPAPDGSALADFLLAMAIDPNLLMAFESDARRAAACAELSPEEVRALLTRMPGRIWEVINQGSASADRAHEELGQPSRS